MGYSVLEIHVNTGVGLLDFDAVQVSKAKASLKGKSPCGKYNLFNAVII